VASGAIAGEGVASTTHAGCKRGHARGTGGIGFAFGVNGRTACGLCLTVFFAGATDVAAETWRFTPSAGITETYTDNVNYAPRNEKGTGDFVTSLSAALGITGEGRRVKLNGTIAATAQVYARETQNNDITPSVNLFGSVEAIERFFFIDASANVSTQFLSPFGPQPGNVVNATNNRYISQTYSVNPYLKGEFGATGITYEVRDENTWTLSGTYGDSTAKPPNTYVNRFTASMTSAASPLGWRVELERNDYDSGFQSERVDNAGSYLTEVARAIFTRQFDGQLQVSLRGGYDRSQFPLTGTEGPVYGAGFQWNPSERTQMGGFWEHRFFGSSFEWKMSHRLPNSAINASFTRGLTSYPQNSLAIPAGTSVAQFVDAAFTSRIPDPVARGQAVEQFLARTGLPGSLAAPVNIYTNQVQLQNAQNISFVLTGRRNSVTFTAFNLKTQAIAGTGDVLPPAFQFGTNNTQTGVGVTFAHQLSGFTGLNAFLTYSRTKSNDSAALDARSNDTNLGANITTRLGPKTTGSMGATYSLYRLTSASTTTTLEPDTDALSIFASVNHTF
jgi:uncharacterized protein (PEP-CTERM system associated)